MNEPMKVEVQGFQVLEKKVKASGGSGRIYVPKEWVGKRVKVVLLESANEDE
jgi:putative transposon-encoded protein